MGLRREKFQKEVPPFHLFEHAYVNSEEWNCSNDDHGGLEMINIQWNSCFFFGWTLIYGCSFPQTRQEFWHGGFLHISNACCDYVLRKPTSLIWSNFGDDFKLPINLLISPPPQMYCVPSWLCEWTVRSAFDPKKCSLKMEPYTEE